MTKETKLNSLENENVENLTAQLKERFKGRMFLTVDDVCEFFGCEKHVVYNWTKRSNQKRRPPRMMLGKTIRFYSPQFAAWVLKEMR